MLALVVRCKLREPEQWQKARQENAVKKQLGSYRELFSDLVLRKHAILGLILGCSGIIGLWSVGFFTPDLIRSVRREPVSEAVYTEKLEEANRKGAIVEAKQWSDLRDHVRKGTPVPEALQEVQAASDPIISGRLSRWASYASLMINLGGFFGTFCFGVFLRNVLAVSPRSLWPSWRPFSAPSWYSGF